MRKFLILLLITIVVAGCRRRSETEDRLSAAEELIEQNPDSAFVAFDKIDISELYYKQKMRYYLLRTFAQNRAYIPFTSDSIMKEVVEYYDSHGTPNEQMIANYLMGCVYADMDNPIVALEYFHNAVEKADTTEENCDYVTLSRVHGQMATLFHIQLLPEYELKEERLAVEYAWKAKDTLAAIQFYEHLVGAYYFMNMRDSVVSVSKNAHRLFKKYGYKEYASETWPSAICVYLEAGQYAEAKILMDDFEQNSVFFDENNEITFGDGTYYGFKGMYYEGINKLDSAEYFYRKLLQFPFRRHNHEISMHGMMSIYEKKKNVDSLAKYARLYCEVNDSSYRMLTADKICRMQAIYDYSYNKQLANKRTIEAKQYKIWAYAATLFILIATCLIYMAYRWLHKKKIQALAKLNNDYSAILLQYSVAKRELSQLLRNHDEYMTAKQEEVERLQKKLFAYQEDDKRSEEWDMEEILLDNHIVKDLHALASRGMTVSDKEWNEFVGIMKQYLPQFVLALNIKDYNLTNREVRVAMLIKLRFIPSEIKVLLNLSSQQVTNTRRLINKKMFGEDGTKSLDSNLRGLEGY